MPETENTQGKVDHFGNARHDNIDILIIGAGPAGTAASICLADHGHIPVLIDQTGFPRNKVCGDAVSGEGLGVLSSFGVMEEVLSEGHQCGMKELFSGKDKFTQINKKAIMLPRNTLDHILAKKAGRSGVQFLANRFTGNIYPSNSKNKSWPSNNNHDSTPNSLPTYRIEVQNPKTKATRFINAKYVIIATGCQSDKIFSKMKTNHLSGPDQMACRGYYKANWPIVERQYHFRDDLNPGYIWIFPMGNNVFNVGCGGKILKARKLNLSQCLHSFVHEMNKKYQCKGEWQNRPKAGYLRTNFSNLNALKKYENVILAGESMGSTYPFSGGGIGKALTSGLIAGKSIRNMIRGENTNKSLSGEYTRMINREMKPSYYRAFTVCNYFLTRTPLQTLIYKRVFQQNASPGVIANIIAKKHSPEAFFTFGGIIRFLLARSLAR